MPRKPSKLSHLHTPEPTDDERRLILELTLRLINDEAHHALHKQLAERHYIVLSAKFLPRLDPEAEGFWMHAVYTPTTYHAAKIRARLDPDVHYERESLRIAGEAAERLMRVDAANYFAERVLWHAG